MDADAVQRGQAARDVILGLDQEVARVVGTGHGLGQPQIGTGPGISGGCDGVLVHAAVAAADRAPHANRGVVVLGQGRHDLAVEARAQLAASAETQSGRAHQEDVASFQPARPAAADRILRVDFGLEIAQGLRGAGVVIGVAEDRAPITEIWVEIGEILLTA